MVRLADLPKWEREHMLKKVPDLPRFESRPRVRGPTLAHRRVAIVTTAGLRLRYDRPFGSGASGMDYRVIPHGAAARDLVMSHVSVNFGSSPQSAAASNTGERSAP